MKNRPLLRVLREAKELLGSRDAWSEQDHAWDAAGTWVPVGSPAAVRFSLMGAVLRCSSAAEDAGLSARRAFAAANPTLYKKYVSVGLSHEESVTLLGDAIGFLGLVTQEAAEGT